MATPSRGIAAVAKAVPTPIGQALGPAAALAPSALLDPARVADTAFAAGDWDACVRACLEGVHRALNFTGEGPRGLSAFLVPAKAPGFTFTKMEMMGEHPIGELHFSGCRVPADARVGDEGAGMKLALSTLDVFRSTVGAAAVGMARRALEEAIAYAKKRKQFGAPLADLPPVQALLADSAVELEASRWLVHAAAAAKDGGQERVTYEAAVGKLFATEAAQRIIDRCLQVHGGNGVVKGAVVERLYRDIRALRIYEGASEVQRLVIARHLLA
jgi:acyl-CoA dehydrogenase